MANIVCVDTNESFTSCRGNSFWVKTECTCMRANLMKTLRPAHLKFVQIFLIDAVFVVILILPFYFSPLS